MCVLGMLSAVSIAPATERTGHLSRDAERGDYDGA